MSAPPILTELRLSEDMQRAVNTAFETLKPIVVSYVDENGRAATLVSRQHAGL